jgi:hypothetical protein
LKSLSETEKTQEEHNDDDQADDVDDAVHEIALCAGLTTGLAAR